MWGRRTKDGACMEDEFEDPHSEEEEIVVIELFNLKQDFLNIVSDLKNIYDVQ